MIRVPQVRVVDEDGAQLGVLPTGEALRLAQERGYDLVEVAPTASPPVVKLLDFGQYKYELAKREKEAKRRSRSVEFKEIRLKPKIGIGDFDTKVHRAIQFLEEGDRIKVTVQFRGRELTHPEIGRNLLTKFTDRVKDHGVLERAPLLEGRAMHIVIASIHKPKSRDANAAPAAEAPTAATKPPVEAPAPAPAQKPATKPAAEAPAPAQKPVAEAPAAAPAQEPATEAPKAAPAQKPATKPATKTTKTAPAAPATVADETSKTTTGAAIAAPASDTPGSPALTGE
jgi:translation initiation factor IF-3